MKQGKLSVAKDILNTKCPSCGTGDMFVYPINRVGKMLKMHPSCPHCGFSYMPEPGFYFGAMYFSYAINVAIMVACGVAFEVIFDPEEIWMTFASVFIPPILIAPWNFRISRALMLYAFGGARKKAELSEE